MEPAPARYSAGIRRVPGNDVNMLGKPFHVVTMSCIVHCIARATACMPAMQGNFSCPPLCGDRCPAKTTPHARIDARGRSLTANPTSGTESLDQLLAALLSLPTGGPRHRLTAKLALGTYRPQV